MRKIGLVTTIAAGGVALAVVLVLITTHGHTGTYYAVADPVRLASPPVPGIQIPASFGARGRVASDSLGTTNVENQVRIYHWNSARWELAGLVDVPLFRPSATAASYQPLR